MSIISSKSKEVVATIFREGIIIPSSIKHLHPRIRIWVNILMSCIHHRPSRISPNYINWDQKFMLYYLEKGIKMNSPSILFKYLREMIKDTRDGVLRPRKWIPLGRIILDVMVESQLVKEFTNLNMSEKLYTEVGKLLNGRTLENMELVAEPIEIEDLDRDPISTRSVPKEDSLLFCNG